MVNINAISALGFGALPWVTLWRLGCGDYQIGPHGYHDDIQSESNIDHHQHLTGSWLYTCLCEACAKLIQFKNPYKFRYLGEIQLFDQTHNPVLG